MARSGDVFIAAGVTRALPGNYGMRADLQGHAIDVMGAVIGDSGGLFLGRASRFVIGRVNVGQNGSIAGRAYGGDFQAALVWIANAGEISGNYGNRHDGGEIELQNSGSIVGLDNDAMFINASAAHIINTGTISALSDSHGLYLNNTTTGNGVTPKVVNYGSITGGSHGTYRGPDDRHQIETFGEIDDVYLGNRNDSVVNGGLLSGELILIGGNDSDDRLQGKEGADTFEFDKGFGRDVIVDFKALNDAEKSDLIGLTEITGFNDVRTNHMVQKGRNVKSRDWINTIKLLSVDLADLDAADFLF